MKKAISVTFLSLVLFALGLQTTRAFTFTAVADATSTTTTAPLDISLKINNPLDSTIGDLPTLVVRILDIVKLIATPIVILLVIYAGFLFVIARGDPKGLEKAKQALLWTVIGAAVLLGATVIATAIQGTITQLSLATLYVV